MLKLSKYTTMHMICFILKRIKFFVSLNGKPSQKAIKTSLAVCSMLTEISYVRYIDQAFNARRLASKILQHQPDTKYTFENRNKVLRYDQRIFHKNISQEYFTRIFHKNISQDYFTRIFHKNIF